VIATTSVVSAIAITAAKTLLLVTQSSSQYGQSLEQPIDLVGRVVVDDSDADGSA
jgi:hypothetical protein